MRPVVARAVAHIVERRVFAVAGHESHGVPHSTSRTSRGGLDVEAVMAEQREREPFEAEADAARVRDVARRGADVPQQPEMVHVVVEAQARGLAIVVLDRDQQLELQVLLALAVRDDLAATPEERIVREVDRVGRRSASIIRVPRSIQVSRNDTICSGVPIRTYSRIRNSCMRVGSSDGS